MERILFVCLGNICRSPAAEEVMRRLVNDAGLEHEFFLDSAGLIDYHEGEPADARMRAHAARRGYHITHISRPVRYDDFFDFDWIVGMDDRNISKLKSLAPGLEEEKESRTHDGLLSAKGSRPCARPLLWRRQRIRECSRHTGRCLCRFVRYVAWCPLTGMQRVPHPFVIFGQSSFSRFFV